MSGTSKPAPDVRFAVTITGDDGNRYGGTQYRKFHARAYIWAPDKYSDSHGYELHDPDSYSIEGGKARALKGLQITAQADNDSMKRAGNEWYAWEVSVDRYVVQLKDAEEILPVLRKIAKRVDALSTELGRPETLAQYCAYAVGAVTRERRPFMHRVTDPARDFEGTGYRAMDANDLAYLLYSDAVEWRKSHGVELDG